MSVRKIRSGHDIKNNHAVVSADNLGNFHAVSLFEDETTQLSESDKFNGRFAENDADLFRPVNYNHVPTGDDTAAIVTVSAESGVNHKVTSIEFGYDASPSGGYVEIQSGGDSFWKHPVTQSGPGQFSFPNGKYDADGTSKELKVVLSAGGSGVIGHISAGIV